MLFICICCHSLAALLDSIPVFPSLSLSVCRRMSAFDSLHEALEQICYVKCCFCNTILLVSVPYSSLAMAVTIWCGHCNNIFSLNMMKLFSSEIIQHQMPKLEVCAEKVGDEEEDDDDRDGKDEDLVWCNQVNNKPTEKKQRAPTAYNHFIKYNRDEIKRLKIENPNITHKQAFSAAAKNWAHCPQSEYKQEEEIHGSDEGDRNMALDDDEVHFLGNAFHEIKALRQCSCNSSPFC